MLGSARYFRLPACTCATEGCTPTRGSSCTSATTTTRRASSIQAGASSALKQCGHNRPCRRDDRVPRVPRALGESKRGARDAAEAHGHSRADGRRATRRAHARLCRTSPRAQRGGRIRPEPGARFLRSGVRSSLRSSRCRFGCSRSTPNVAAGAGLLVFGVAQGRCSWLMRGGATVA
jgi:hypothetical protein